MEELAGETWRRPSNAGTLGATSAPDGGDPSLGRTSLARGAAGRLDDDAVEGEATGKLDDDAEAGAPPVEELAGGCAPERSRRMPDAEANEESAPAEAAVPCSKEATSSPSTPLCRRRFRKDLGVDTTDCAGGEAAEPQPSPGGGLGSLPPTAPGDASDAVGPSPLCGPASTTLGAAGGLELEPLGV